MNESKPKAGSAPSERALLAYLLGTLPFDELQLLQRRLMYEIGGNRDSGALIICDHPPGITVGREGSRVHVRPGPDCLAARGWRVRWLGRGGGTFLHLPGQVACYPMIALDAFSLRAAEYVALLQSLVVDLLAAFGLEGMPDARSSGVRVNGRRIAHIGTAVRDNISCFGLVVNVDPDLEWFRDVRCDGDPIPMTSIQRESAGRVRIAAVRQMLTERFAARLGFDRLSVFHNLPELLTRPTRNATARRT